MCDHAENYLEVANFYDDLKHWFTAGYLVFIMLGAVMNLYGTWTTNVYMAYFATVGGLFIICSGVSCFSPVIGLVCWLAFGVYYYFIMDIPVDPVVLRAMEIDHDAAESAEGLSIFLLHTIATVATLFRCFFGKLEDMDKEDLYWRRRTAREHTTR